MYRSTVTLIKSPPDKYLLRHCYVVQHNHMILFLAQGLSWCLIYV